MRKAQLKSYWQDQELSRILIQLSEALNPFPFERLRNAWIYTNVIYGVVFFYPRPALFVIIQLHSSRELHDKIAHKYVIYFQNYA